MIALRRGLGNLEQQDGSREGLKLKAFVLSRNPLTDSGSRLEVSSITNATAQKSFSLGQLLATPGALGALEKAKQTVGELLYRHQTGDWGDLGEEDKAENDFSVDKYLRIFSAYILSTGVKIWVITEADRSVTTILLPSEY